MSRKSAKNTPKKKPSKQASKGNGGQRARSRADEAGPGAVGRVFSAAGAGIAVAWRNASTTAFVLAVLAIALGWGLGRPWLEDRVREFRSEALTFQTNAPEAYAAKLNGLGLYPVQLVNQRAAAAITFDPFDRASLDEAALALERTGWFLDVPRVTRRPSGVIEIDGAWRVPSAVVEHRGGTFLVDHEGVPMMTDAAWRPSDQLIRIYDPPLTPAQRSDGSIAFGEPWRGGAVRSAIELAAYLRRAGDEARASNSEPAIDRIAGIDLSDYDATATGRLRLRTHNGGTIVWGAPIDEFAPGEVNTDTKLRQLRQLFASNSGWDQRGGTVSVNLQGLIIERPIGSGGG